MPNTSATGGYLTPAVSPAPTEDEAFEDFLQQVIVGITGIDQTLVRPGWQPDPPNQPARDQTWIAFRIMRQAADSYAYIDPQESSSELQRVETVEVLLSSFGPNASSALATFRDGVLIDQNRFALEQVKIGQTETGEIIPAPTIVKEKWLRRFDMTWTFRRMIIRDYPILSLISAQGFINTEVITVPFNVEPPTP